MQVRIEQGGAVVGRVALGKLVSTVGRGAGCDVVLGPAEPPVRLGMFIRKEDGHVFKPLAGGGFFTRAGIPMDRMKAVRPGDVLEIGGWRLVLEGAGTWEDEAPAEDTWAPSAAKPTIAERTDGTERPAVQEEPAPIMSRAGVLRAYAAGAPAAASQVSTTPRTEAAPAARPAVRSAPAPVAPPLSARPAVRGAAPAPELAGPPAPPPLAATLHAELLERLAARLERPDARGGEIDLELDRLVSEMTAGLRGSGDEADRLARDLAREFRLWGPLAPCGRDGQAREVVVEAWDRVLVRGLSGAEASPGPSFRDARHLRLFARLLRLSAEGGQEAPAGLFRGTLPDGTLLTIMEPPLRPAGVLLRLEKPVPAVDLERLVAEGRLSAGMAAWLRLALRRKAGVLVCGAPGPAAPLLLGALLGEAGPGARPLLLQARPAVAEREGLAALRLPASGREAVLAEALRLEPGFLACCGLDADGLAGLLLGLGPGATPVATLPYARPEAALAMLVDACGRAAPGLDQVRCRELVTDRLRVAAVMDTAPGVGPVVARLVETGLTEAGLVLREIFLRRPDGAFARGAQMSVLVRDAREAGLDVPFGDYGQTEA